MKPSELKWAISTTLCISTLMILGGYHQRGYLTFDGGCVLWLLLLVVIVVYNQVEKAK